MEVDMMKKVPVREQAPEVRAKNFEEVCEGYNKEEAMAEATLIGVSAVPWSILSSGFSTGTLSGDVLPFKDTR